MGIKAKLLLSFAAVLVIAVAIGGVGWWVQTTLGTHLHEISNASLPSVRTLGQISAAQRGVVLGQRALAGSGLTPEQRQAQFDWIEEKLDDAEAAFAEYEQLPQGAEEAEAWRKFEPVYTEWMKDGEHLLTLAHQVDAMGIHDPRTVQHTLLARERDHAHWANALEGAVHEHRAFDGQLDPSACTMGQWLQQYQPDSAEMRSFLAAIATPHQELHQAGREVNERIQAGDFDEAERIYHERVRPALAQLRTHFSAASAMVDRSAAVDQQVWQAAYIDARQSFLDSQKLLDELVDINVKAAEHATVQAEADSHMSSVLLVGAVLAGMAAGLVLAVWQAGRITRPIRATTDMIKDIATGDGDLTKRLDVRSKDEVGHLAGWFNQFVDQLHAMIVNVAGAADDVAAAATEISASNEQISGGAQQQSAQTTEIASAIEQMSATVMEVARNASSAAEAASGSVATAREGSDVVEKTVSGIQAISRSTDQASATIGELGQASEKVGQIIGVINDIADQTNLLALNAAIEAARAGEHGRGFAVVADEVRKLAERTAEATQEVARTIRGIQQTTGGAVSAMDEGGRQVRAGVELATQAGSALQRIVASVTGISDTIGQIAAASEEQSAASEQISRTIESITGVTKQNAVAVQQAAAASQQLAHRAEELQGMVQRFKLDRSAKH